MEKRIFGKSGRSAGVVGLGTWQLGAGWGDVSDEDAGATLKVAYECGTNFFDTADVYGAGRSETLIGKFLRETKASVFVATKFGRSSDPGWPENFTRAGVRRHTEASLKRLGVERIDLTQAHCIPKDVMASGEVWEALRELKREGKIADFGASVESMEEAIICLKQEDILSLQIIFNIYRQKPIETLFKQSKAHNVAIIVRLPLASGLLSGKFTKATTFSESDHRNFNRDGGSFNVGETFAGLPFDKGVELTDELKPLVPSSMSMADMSLRWCLDHDAVSVIIPGATRPEQARRNALVGDIAPLGADLHRKLSDFYERKVKQHVRGPY